MKSDWLKWFPDEEPAPHVPESVIALSFVALNIAGSCSVDLLLFKADLAGRCESPIEIELGSYLMLAAEDRFEVRPQYPLGPYRYDFAVMSRGQPVLLVECDSLQFHSTAEQIANDVRKDAMAEHHSLPLIRVSGREIYRAPCIIAKEIINLAIRGRS